MNTIQRAICCAVFLLVAAAASRYGVMDRGSATTLFIVLPIVAWTTMTGRGSCSFNRGR